MSQLCKHGVRKINVCQLCINEKYGSELKDGFAQPNQFRHLDDRLRHELEQWKAIADRLAHCLLSDYIPELEREALKALAEYEQLKSPLACRADGPEGKSP